MRESNWLKRLTASWKGLWKPTVEYPKFIPKSQRIIAQRFGVGNQVSWGLVVACGQGREFIDLGGGLMMYLPSRAGKNGGSAPEPEKGSDADGWYDDPVIPDKLQTMTSRTQYDFDKFSVWRKEGDTLTRMNEEEIASAMEAAGVSFGA
jgi:hypothetical protein